MSDVFCDGCEEQPYVAPSTKEDVQYEMWCECPTHVPIVLKDTEYSSVPNYWGEASEVRFVCYQCGDDVVLLSTVGSRGIQYHVRCRCDENRFGVDIGWRGVHPPEWKRDMDPTKWDRQVWSDILDTIESYQGSLTHDEIVERVDHSPAAVKCARIHLMRSNDLYRVNGDEFTTIDYIDIEDGVDEVSNDVEDSDDSDDRGWFAERVRSWV